MADRDGFGPGTPCWVDHGSVDPMGAAEFYTGLFGWETADQMPPDAPGHYLMCTLRGRSVAAIGSQPQEGVPAMWNTYIATASADETAEKVEQAGGTVMMSPFDVFDAGRMAVVADPAGAVFCLWEARGHLGAQIVNEPGALAWNELITRDAEGSKDFYGAVFGWRSVVIQSGGVDYTVWNPAGDDPPSTEAGIGGMLPMVGDMWSPSLPSHWMVYFAVDDTDAAAGRAEELGGKISVPAFDTPAGRIAVLNDPVGAAFSIIALARDPAE